MNWKFSSMVGCSSLRHYKVHAYIVLAFHHVMNRRQPLPWSLWSSFNQRMHFIYCHINEAARECKLPFHLLLLYFPSTYNSPLSSFHNYYNLPILHPPLHQLIFVTIQSSKLTFNPKLLHTVKCLWNIFYKILLLSSHMSMSSAYISLSWYSTIPFINVAVVSSQPCWNDMGDKTLPCLTALKVWNHSAFLHLRICCFHVCLECYSIW
jgi:hypothetical protein